MRPSDANKTSSNVVIVCLFVCLSVHTRHKYFNTDKSLALEFSAKTKLTSLKRERI